MDKVMNAVGYVQVGETKLIPRKCVTCGESPGVYATKEGFCYKCDGGHYVVYGPNITAATNNWNTLMSWLHESKTAEPGYVEDFLNELVDLELDWEDEEVIEYDGEEEAETGECCCDEERSWEGAGGDATFVPTYDPRDSDWYSFEVDAEEPNIAELIMHDVDEDNWVHRSENMLCGTCMWYVMKQTSVPGVAEIGRCRRHAPTMNGYPVVYVTDWCGDHKLDEEKL